MTNYPQIRKAFEKYSHIYKDPFKNWLQRVLCQIQLFKSMPRKALHDIEHTLIKEVHDARKLLLKVGDNCDKIIIVQVGWLEVYTLSDNQEFIIERLSSGSVLNYRSFFIEDVMQVNVRTLSKVHLLVLTREQLLKR